MKILMVLTSHDQLGTTGRKTGFWLEEFAAPYFIFRDADAEVTLVSPKGGQPPIDPKSDLPENQTPAMARFKKDERAQQALAHTFRLADVKAEDFDAVFYPGGHGPMWDLAENPDSIALIESFYNSGKFVAFVCHAPGVLRHVTYKGEPLVKGRHVTGFTNGEEEEVQLTRLCHSLSRMKCCVSEPFLKRSATGSPSSPWMAASLPVRIRLHQLPQPGLCWGCSGGGWWRLSFCSRDESSVTRTNGNRHTTNEAKLSMLSARARRFGPILSEDVDWICFVAFPRSVRLAVLRVGPRGMVHLQSRTRCLVG